MREPVIHMFQPCARIQAKTANARGYLFRGLERRSKCDEIYIRRMNTGRLYRSKNRFLRQKLVFLWGPVLPNFELLDSGDNAVFINNCSAAAVGFCRDAQNPHRHKPEYAIVGPPRQPPENAGCVTGGER